MSPVCQVSRPRPSHCFLTPPLGTCCLRSGELSPLVALVWTGKPVARSGSTSWNFCGLSPMRGDGGSGCWLPPVCALRQVSGWRNNSQLRCLFSCHQLLLQVSDTMWVACSRAAFRVGSQVEGSVPRDLAHPAAGHQSESRTTPASVLRGYKFRGSRPCTGLGNLLE